MSVSLNGSLNTLPSRDQLERAIATYWARGRSSQLLVDVLRRESATVTEARALAERLAVRADRTGYLDDGVVTEQLEMLRAAWAVRSNDHKPSDAKPSSRYFGLAWDDRKGWVWASGSHPKSVCDCGDCNVSRETHGFSPA